MNDYTTYVGMDVHARSIMCKGMCKETGELYARLFVDGPSSAEVHEWMASLPQPVYSAYESGCTGFWLARELRELGDDCDVIAISTLPRSAKDKQGKCDKLDAKVILREIMNPLSDCSTVWLPDVETEAARDLARAREDCREDLMRARHLLSKLLLRKGIVYDGGGAWTKRHREWLSRVDLADPCERLVLEEYLEGVRSLELRRSRLDAAIAERAKAPDLAPVVSALCCLRGISTVTAFSIAAEIGDFTRFPTARSFMSYLGLVPSESSSGETVSRGRITRAGNGHVRTLLVESAWHHARRRSPMSATSLADARGVPAPVAEAAERANGRLHERSVRLRSRGKPANLANAAVARELAGFVWALAAMAQAE